ncbi:hypothetical protein EDWATA_01150 [Edwardsiella tarda ATCC 23685]|uniref:Uncharacterized protein n=1 Tax=Edwardsiella tarda ATCC 23685 TaxID=500638 RepID=D4F348_EDWTA|nr:hypothetical protein EDWATA_01150 [Edwardsiella tarda ATCC 23685]
MRDKTSPTPPTGSKACAGRLITRTGDMTSDIQTLSRSNRQASNK